MKFKSKKVGRFCEVQTGPFGSQLHSEDYVLEGTPIVTVEHLGNRKFSTQNLPKVSDDDRQRLSKYLLKTGDLVFSRVGSVDRISFVSEEENGWLYSGRCLRIRIKEEIDSQWLYYYFCQEKIKELVRSIAVGATMPSINTKLLSEIPICYPENINDQKKIAKILSALDDKIECNNQINKNLEEQAQALFKKFFIDIDLIPDGWSKGCLLDIADYLNGLAMQKFRPSERDIGLPVLKIKELRQGMCDDSSEKCSSSIKDEYIVHDGDVIFSWSGSLLVDFWCGGTCGLNQHLFKVTSKNYDKWFYYFWTLYHLGRFSAIASAKATTMGHIKREDLMNAEVVLPSKKDYKKIDILLKPIVNLIIKNRIENRKLAQLRDTLLPKLMSGELDVSDIDI